MDLVQLNKMNINLEDDKKEYESGEEVKGVLTLDINGKLMLSTLKIGLVCMAEVKLLENPGRRPEGDLSSVARVYHKKDKYLDLKYEITEYLDKDFVEEGEHLIPFSFQLPNGGIPSSFQSPANRFLFGSISYFIEAILEEPVVKEMHKICYKFIVDSPIGENLKSSISAQTEKDFGILSLGSGQISFHSSVDKSGFIPGQIIELHCTVENDSTVDATPRATLYQKQIYICGERQKTQEIALSNRIIGSKVVKGTNNSETFYIPIPKEASLSIDCSMICIKYNIHATLDIPNATDLHLDLPIVVTNKSALMEKFSVIIE